MNGSLCLRIFVIISYLAYLLHCCTLPDKRCLFHDMYLYKVMMMLHFLTDVDNDAKSTQKNENYVINASFKSKSMGTLIHRIPGLRLLISSLPGSAFRTHVESLGKPRDVNKHSQSLVNLISKDTHLVFSINMTFIINMVIPKESVFYKVSLTIIYIGKV